MPRRKPNRNQQSKRERSQKRQLEWAKKSPGAKFYRSVILGPPKCPTPTKRRFGSREGAAAVAPPNRSPYKCKCGEWHLTTRPKPPKEKP